MFGISDLLGVQNRYSVHIKFPERAAVNGTDNDPEENGESPTTTENEDQPKKCDIILITGKDEQAELAKQALLVSI